MRSSGKPYYCPSCDEQVDARFIEDGIGVFEAWGVKMSDTNEYLACCQCDYDLSDQENEE